jgi:hypothetical protein
MSIFNRRNAFLGWLTWLGAKHVMKEKAKQAVPGKVEGTRRPNKGAIVAVLAAVGGVLFFWRRSGDDAAG